MPDPTARLVNAARESGARVIAVGTTVVRALETVAGPGSRVTAGEGWTDLIVIPERGLRAVDGVLTGWHEPRASHLAMLEAAAGEPLLRRSYAEALAHGYLWHEFGDSHLILAARPGFDVASAPAMSPVAAARLTPVGTRRTGPRSEPVTEGVRR